MFLWIEMHTEWILVGLCALLLLWVVCLLLGRRPRLQTARPAAEGLLDEMLSAGEDTAYILLRTRDSAVLYVSAGAQQLLRMPVQDILADVDVLAHLLDDHDRRALTVLRDGKPLNEPLRYRFLRQPDGTRWLELTSTPVGPDKVRLRFEDVTQNQQQTEALQQEIEETRAIDQSKTSFLSQMSHEIRTPMNGILGMLALAKYNLQSPPVLEDYLTKAESLSQFLLSIINNVLDMSRIESGKVEIEHIRLDLFALREKLYAMFAPTMESRKIHFSVNMEDFTVRYVLGDELRITQVVNNFLSNAGKFTPEGGTVEVTFRQLQLQDGVLQLMVRVRDSGKGMAPEFLSRIFRPFEQEDRTVARKYGGSGLGMAISDNLVRLMNGTITVDSTLGKGSDFTLYLPLEVAPGDQTLPAENTSLLAVQSKAQDDSFTLQGVRILMAEDHPINAMVATRLLERQGAIMDVVGDGKQAMDRFAERPVGSYDVILMDIQMPVMNGWDAARGIRAMDRPDAKTIPIFALSADAFAEDKRRTLASGMNGHIAKPIDYAALKEALHQVL